MTANKIFESIYGWADTNAGLILLSAVLLPLLGAAAAKVGKGGKTDADGKLIASIVVGSGIVFFVIEIALMLFTRSVFGKGILEANAMLLLAPIVYLGLGVATVRWVFPLSQLGSVRQAQDIGAFVLVCWGIVWLFGKFHWGIIFFGSLLQLVIILILGAIFVRRLYRRALTRQK